MLHTEPAGYATCVGRTEPPILNLIHWQASDEPCEECSRFHTDLLLIRKETSGE